MTGSAPPGLHSGARVEMSPAIPDPRESGCFVFSDCAYDPASGTARLAYRFDDGPELVETIVFPWAPWPPEASRQDAFLRALKLLHLVAGVSYYKAGLSPRFEFREPEFAKAAGDFLQTLYLEGLAEFAYVNRLDLVSRIRFPETASAQVGASPLLLRDRALVAMGGGKDSLVGLELMRRADIEVMPICVGGSELIADTVAAAGLPLLRTQRQLAPQLAEMNRAGAWNGHVPVTAVNSAILVCAAILYGSRYVVFANERSADEATLTAADGHPVNHQYSKSSAFERAFRDVVHSLVSPDIEYFSILRPFSELDVVRQFSRMTAFHAVYSSCNRNFHLDGPRVQGRWCGDCPKCRFAALSLAVFLPPEDVKAIQGKDLLDDAGQIDGFRELCGLGRDKPFECVGEIGESRAAMAALFKREAWSSHAVVRALREELAAVAVPEMDELLKARSAHFIPAPIARRLELPGKAS
jgi:hypothetical protein